VAWARAAQGGGLERREVRVFLPPPASTQDEHIVATREAVAVFTKADARLLLYRLHAPPAAAT
jgi:hypothetical protein